MLGSERRRHKLNQLAPSSAAKTDCKRARTASQTESKRRDAKRVRVSQRRQSNPLDGGMLVIETVVWVDRLTKELRRIWNCTRAIYYTFQWS
eukprot:scaffold1362_cov163-Amphora_coffeaeformis.AAC.3